MRHRIINIPAGGLPKAGQRAFNLAPGTGVKALQAGASLLVTITGEIGWDLNLESVRAVISQAPAADLEVQINSPGGDVFEGIAIHNLLIQHPGAVHCKVMGLAASAASIIAMAGDTVAIGSGAFLMIHRAWASASGNAAGHRELADILDAIDGELAGIYSARTGQKPADITAMMEAETWLNASRAVDLGFADAAITSDPPQARFDLSAYAKAPTGLSALHQAPLPPAPDANAEFWTALSAHFAAA